jgi:rod shape-determining protein MreD
MHWMRFAVVIVIVTMLQMSLVDIIAVTTADIKPDLLLILLVFFAIHCEPTEAVITAFATGFAADIIGPTMGPQIISFGVFGTLLADLHRVVALRKKSYQAFGIFATGFLTSALALLLTFLKAEPVAANTYTQLFWVPLYSAILGPFLFVPLGWLMRIKRPRGRRR